MDLGTVQHLLTIEEMNQRQICYAVGINLHHWESDQLVGRLRFGSNPVDLGSTADDFAVRNILAKPHKSKQLGVHYIAALWNDAGDVGQFPSAAASPFLACCKVYLKSLEHSGDKFYVPAILAT